MNKWVESEMAELSLGDERLNKRLKGILEEVSKSPDQPFTKQFQTAAELKGCYRFLDSDLASPEAILEPHLKKTVERSQHHDVVVVSSDSSSANFTTRTTHPDTGYISSNNAQGFLMHVSMATTLDRLPLGVVDAKFWARDKSKPSKKVHRDYLPIEDKESFKWIESYRKAQLFAKSLPNSQVINVADKEADILELWKEAVVSSGEENGAHLIVRSNHNRAVAPTDSNPNTRLKPFIEAVEPIGTSEFELIDRKTHKTKRIVRQEIKAAPIRVRPVKRPGVEVVELDLWAVSLMELEPPEGETPVEWCLLTTLPIATSEDAEKIVHAYLARWDIEVLFRTFKSGCKVEDRSLRTAKRVFAMFSIFLITAWRINMLTRITRLSPNLPCSVLFTDVEWKAAVTASTKSLALPDTEPTVHDILIMIACLGGYLNRKSDPLPGATVIWRGLTYLKGFADAFELLSGAAKTESKLPVKNTCG